MTKWHMARLMGYRIHRCSRALADNVNLLKLPRSSTWCAPGNSSKMHLIFFLNLLPRHDSLTFGGGSMFC